MPRGKRKTTIQRAPEAMAEIGHNSIAASALEKLLTEIEELKERKADLQSEIRDVFEAGKEAGYDTKIMRKILAWRALPPDQRAAQRRQLEIYAEALQLEGLFG